MHLLPADRFSSDRLVELEKGHLDPGMLARLSEESNSRQQECMERRGARSSCNLSGARKPSEARREVRAMGLDKTHFISGPELAAPA